MTFLSRSRRVPARPGNIAVIATENQKTLTRSLGDFLVFVLIAADFDSRCKRLRWLFRAIEIELNQIDRLTLCVVTDEGYSVSRKLVRCTAEDEAFV